MNRNMKIKHRAEFIHRRLPPQLTLTQIKIVNTNTSMTPHRDQAHTYKYQKFPKQDQENRPLVLAPAAGSIP